MDQTLEPPTGAATYSSAMAEASNYIAWILAAFRPHLRAPVIEIGVGHGSYAESLAELGDYLGVDIDSASVEDASGKYPHLKFQTADICGPSFLGLSRTFGAQTIICLNVLEHIPDDQLAIDNLARALPPGGKLLIIVPALDYLFNDLDRLAGHHRRYSRSMMQDRMTKAGLKIVRCDYFNPIGGLGWLANRVVKHKDLNDSGVNGQITLFDKWLVPASRLLDPVSRSTFGQSIIAVGQAL